MVIITSIYSDEAKCAWSHLDIPGAPMWGCDPKVDNHSLKVLTAVISMLEFLFKSILVFLCFLWFLILVIIRQSNNCLKTDQQHL